MVTSYSTSEEENIPYLQKFNQNPSLLQNTADQHACKLLEHRPSEPDPSLLPTPGLVPKSYDFLIFPFSK